METYAYFDNIHQHILQEVNQTKFDITAAIAWFTDKDIYNLLCKKAAQNVGVRLLLIRDRINTGQYGLNFDRLKDLGGEVFFIPDPKHGGATMHNKFCIVDYNTVVTGSYNWSKRARQNYENITIIKNDTDFAQQYLEEFENILAINHLKKKVGIRPNFAQIINRLDIIKNLVCLGETEEINRHLEKLRFSEGDHELQEIVSLLQSSDFDRAILRIDEYKTQRQAITEYNDPEIPSLKLEFKSLEIEIGTLNDEKAEIEKQLLNFNNLQNLFMGEVLTEYFRLRKEQLRRKWVSSEENSKKSDNFKENPEERRSKYEEANREYEEYRADYEASKHDTPLAELTEKEQKKLKDLYRQSSRLCHPDKVVESDKERAQQTFVELQDAYKKNDLKALERILQNLKEGKIFAHRSEIISEKDGIKRQILYLRLKIEKMLDQINQLVSTSVWQTITTIEDWGDYFDDQKNKLETEIELMKAALENE